MAIDELFEPLKSRLTWLNHRAVQHLQQHLSGFQRFHITDEIPLGTYPSSDSLTFCPNHLQLPTSTYSTLNDLQCIVPDRVHDTTREHLLEVLTTNDWRQLLDLKCQLFTWRSINGRLLRWSVQESALLRDDKGNDAISLLNRVHNEVVAQIEVRRRDVATRPPPGRMPSTAIKRRFTDPKPPKVITERRWEGTELGQLYSGAESLDLMRRAAERSLSQITPAINAAASAAKGILAQRKPLASTGIAIDALMRQAALGRTQMPEHLGSHFERLYKDHDASLGIATRKLLEPLDTVRIGMEVRGVTSALTLALTQSKALFAQIDQANSYGLASLQEQLRAVNGVVAEPGHWITTNKDHPYHVAAKKVEAILDQLSSREWQRLPIERQAQDDENVKKEINRNEVAVTRAINSLVDEGLIERLKVGGQVQVRLATTTA